MGCSASVNPINEGASLKLSPAPTHINDPIDDEGSSSLPLQEPVDVEKSSNLSTHPTDIQQKNKNEGKSQSEENMEDDFGWLEQDQNEEKELTDKEMQSRKDSLFRLLNKAIKEIHIILSSENEEEKWREDLYEYFVRITNFYYTIKKIGRLPVNILNKYRREAGQQISGTKSVGVVCKVVTIGWQKCSKKQGSKLVEPPSKEMLAALLILWNFSDCSPEVTYDIVRDPNNILNTLDDILTSYRHERIEEEEMSEGESYMVGASLSIIHNLSNVDANVTPLRERGFVAIVSPYLDSKETLDRFKALATLANLIDEKESKILQGKDELLKMFLETLETALQTTSHTCDVNSETWSAWECTLTIRCLARNDANKRLLVKMDCFPHLVNLAKCGTVEEQREAVGAIRVLAFDDGNQEKIVKDKELNIVDLLIDIRETSEDKEVRKAADGTLWILRGKLENNETYKHKVSSFLKWEKPGVAGKRGSMHEVADDKKGHIMISYNWSHQKELITIRDKLIANGYFVWMDIDNMGGSTLQTMAEAVEMAHVVLVCMSQKYKDSPDCRSEAEYAYKLRKIIVPLRMEAGYTPDGWLGIIEGSKMFYDFSGKYPFETKLKGLIKELAACYAKGGLETKVVPKVCQSPDDTVDAVPVSIQPRSVAHPGHQTSLAQVQRWTQENVNTWLDKHNLSNQHFGHLTGKDLTALVKMKEKAPEYFFNCLERKLKIDSLSIMDTFTDALEDLTS